MHGIRTPLNKKMPGLQQSVWGQSRSGGMAVPRGKFSFRQYSQGPLPWRIYSLWKGWEWRAGRSLFPLFSKNGFSAGEKLRMGKNPSTPNRPLARKGPSGQMKGRLPANHRGTLKMQANIPSVRILSKHLLQDMQAARWRFPFFHS